MEVSKKYFSKEDMFLEYEVYYDEIYDEVNRQDVLAYIFNDGYRKRRFWFLSIKECFEFLNSYLKPEFYVFFLQRIDFIKDGNSVSIDKEYIKEIQVAYAYLENSPSIIKSFFVKYLSNYNFLYLFTKENMENTSHNYYVYNWHIVDGHKIFFVNSSDSVTDLKSYHQEGKKYIELLKESYELNYEIILDSLTYIESQIAMRGYMFSYEDSGEFILGVSAGGYRWRLKHKANEIRDWRYTNGELISPHIIYDDFYKIYFPPILEPVKYDPVDAMYLKQVYFTGTRLTHHKIKGMLLEKGFIFSDRLLKKTTAIIEPGDMTVTDFIIYKKMGLKIYHEDDLFQFLDKYTYKSSIADANHSDDFIISDNSTRCDWREIKNLGNESKGFDEGYNYYVKGEKLRKTGELDKAIELFDMARENGYDAPALYNSYYKLYRAKHDYVSVIVLMQEQIDRTKFIHGDDDIWFPFYDEMQMKILKEKEKLHKQIKCLK